MVNIGDVVLCGTTVGCVFSTEDDAVCVRGDDYQDHRFLINDVQLLSDRETLLESIRGCILNATTR
jgi:hypothetical protein